MSPVHEGTHVPKKPLLCEFQCSALAEFEIRTLRPAPAGDTSNLCLIHAMIHLDSWSNDDLDPVKDDRQDENDYEAVPS